MTTCCRDDISLCNNLTDRIRTAALHRPLRVDHYDPGEQIILSALPLTVAPRETKLHMVVENYVGGGYAGQVYRVRILSTDGAVPGLVPGTVYALKLLIPPSRAARAFRDLLYAIGFQGAFQPQCNPAAARAGALWQKLIRRGAKVWFGSEEVVNDVYATVVDEKLGCCGEISSWVDGRTWRLEADERMDYRALWQRGYNVSSELLGSPEYRAKREFMRSLVELLHAMGAHELARQYEWRTCKSQPNCLKRTATDNDPDGGLVAVDFRAGLTLLPFLPMSPGDVGLIIKGISRGSFVQFDRGDLNALERFVTRHADEFGELTGLVNELKEAERKYRDALPDITHHGLRLLYSRQLWKTILGSAVRGWRVSGLIDDWGERRLRGRPAAIVVFGLLGVIPLAGRVLRRLWAHDGWRRHYVALLGNGTYLRRALAVRRAESALAWYRDGRLSQRSAARVADSAWTFCAHLPLALLPAGLHRLVTDPCVLRKRLHDIFVRPLQLYFDATLREQWLIQMLEEGRRKHMLSDEDSAAITASIREPYIQRYLQSLAVHVCTLPVTQVVSVSLAIGYVLTHPQMPHAQAWTIAAGIIALFQVLPISPGSLVRGLYVLYVVLRERNIKDYAIALALGFFKYVGYLSFPIQMTYRYPALARFMAGHWATEVVHIVPVFGERGALLEHWAFDTFYNWPLTIRRRLRERLLRRSRQKPRRWPAVLVAVGAGAVLSVVEYTLWALYGLPPSFRNAGTAIAGVAMAIGSSVTCTAGGSSLKARLVQALIAAPTAAVLSGVATAAWVACMLGATWTTFVMPLDIIWRIFAASVLSALGMIITEMLLPDPQIKTLARQCGFRRIFG